MEKPRISLLPLLYLDSVPQDILPACLGDPGVGNSYPALQASQEVPTVTGRAAGMSS